MYMSVEFTKCSQYVVHMCVGDDNGIAFKTARYPFHSFWTNTWQEDRTRTRRMAATSLPSLLLLLTTAQLLSGGGQAAYLQEPENPGTLQQDSPAGGVQYYEPFRSYPLEEGKAEYQLFENPNRYQPQDELESPTTAQVESFLSAAEEIAAVSSDTCVDEYKAQLKKLEDMKKSCNSAGFHDCCQV